MKNTTLYKSFLFFMLCLGSAATSWSQESGTIGVEQPTFVGPHQTGFYIGYVLLAGDTLPHWYLQEVTVLENYLNKDRSNQMYRLRHNVMKVYPYAVEAARIINEVDIELKKADNKKDRKKYLKSLENQLNDKFKEPLKNLSTTQGAILVKLINRQSGKDVYSIIKELKGGFSARISQTAFYFFDNNLKTQYDPYNADKDIETIVREIESKAYYNYQIQNTKLIKMQGK